MLPEGCCQQCAQLSAPEVKDLVRNGMWPASPLKFQTVYSDDVFRTYEQLKLDAPSMSCFAFTKMLEASSTRHGRVKSTHYIHYKLLFAHTFYNIAQHGLMSPSSSVSVYVCTGPNALGNTPCVIEMCRGQFILLISIHHSQGWGEVNPIFSLGV